jgi:hypothetical protein
MKLLLTCLICLICATDTPGQKTEYFEFFYPEKKITYSVFDQVEFADNRLIKDYVGIAIKGENKKPVPIWLHDKLSAEIRKLVDSAIKNVPKQPHTGLLNFRNFYINEQKGQFELAVECYAKWDDEYWLVYRVDTLYTIKGSGMKEKLNQKASKEMSNLITTLTQLDLSKRANTLPVSFDYISNIDNNEKKDLPVFNVRKPAKGVYYTYSEFKNNKPRVTSFKTVKGRDRLSYVLRPAVGNKLAKKIPRDSIFVVCDGQDTWIAASHEYTMLNKRGLDFYFQATAYENNKIEEISLTTFYFGLAGGIIAAIPRKAMFEFKLNHTNGKFILLRRAAD